MQIKDIIIALLIETSHRIVEEIGLIEAMRIANAYEILIPFTTFITETCGFHFVLSFRLPHDLKTPYLAFFFISIYPQAESFVKAIIYILRAVILGRLLKNRENNMIKETNLQLESEGIMMYTNRGL